MSVTLRSGLIVAVVSLLTLALSAQQSLKPIDIAPIQISPSSLGRAPIVPPGPPAKAVQLIGAIAVPPFISSIDIMFVDQVHGKLYIADRSTCGIDVIDAVTSTFVSRITSSAFICSSVGGVANAGPNGILVTPDNRLWAGDSNSTMQVIDLNTNQVVKTIATGTPTENRADELAYDPFNRVIVIANDGSNPPRATFYNADTYAVRGTVLFPDAGGAGLEQPVWSTRLHAFVINVPGPTEYLLVMPPSIYDTTGTLSTDPNLKRFPIAACAAVANGGVNGLAYAPSLNLFAASGCANAYLVSGDTGAVTPVPQTGGGDEVWYNEGDGQFYFVPLGAGNCCLNDVDAKSATWLQAASAARLRNVAAYEGNNHIFSVSTRPPAGTADTTPCPQFGLPPGNGCVLVFSHN